MPDPAGSDDEHCGQVPPGSQPSCAVPAVRMIFIAISLAVVAALAITVSADAAPQEAQTISSGEAAGLADVFVPSLDGAEFVVTFQVQRSWGPSKTEIQVVTRHGDWVRIDAGEDGRDQRVILG